MVLPLLLAACAGLEQDVAQPAGQRLWAKCEACYDGLKAATVHVRTGRLSVADADRLLALEAIVDPLCAKPEPGHLVDYDDALAAVEARIAEVLILRSKGEARD